MSSGTNRQDERIWSTTGERDHAIFGRRHKNKELTGQLSNFIVVQITFYVTMKREARFCPLAPFHR